MLVALALSAHGQGGEAEARKGSADRLASVPIAIGEHQSRHVLLSVLRAKIIV
jgi:hypothetical protein